MPDLTDREKREQELAAALLLLWAPVAANPTWDGAMRVRWAVPSTMRQTLQAVYTDAAGRLADELGRPVAEQAIIRAGERWASQYSTALADQIAGTTAKMMADGMSQAGTISAEAAATAFSTARAELIAATEVTRAVTAGEVGLAGYLTMQGLGQYVSLWHTADDERVCEVCGPLDGTGVEVYGTVSPDGPPIHPRCRCWLDWNEF